MNQSNFIYDLMRLFIRTDTEAPLFQKRGCQRAPLLIQEAANRIVSQLPDRVDAVCALGTSGLALGVFLAHELHVPLYFYKSDGWPRLKDGRTLHVLPEPTKPIHVLLADSHYRPSYSWAKAETFLRENTPLEPVVIGLMFQPDTNEPVKRCKAPILSVVKATENAKVLCNLLGCDSEFELIQMLAPESKLWGITRRPTDVGAPGRFLRHTDALLLPRKKSPPHCSVIPVEPELGTRIEGIPMSDPGIWQYYRYPDLVQDMSIAIGQGLDFSGFSYLVGVSVLGTAVALSLAYYNMVNFKDTRVFSAYFEKRLVPPPHPDELTEGEILLCQMRLTTGLLTNDAIKLIQREEGSCSNLLAIRTDLSIEPRRRQRPLGIAGGRGLKRVHTFVYSP
jgi:hypothetical protein